MDIDVGIMTKFTGLVGGLHNSFYTAIGGRMYQGFTPVSTSPYCVFFLVGGKSDPNFSHIHEETRWQFSLYSNSKSRAELESLFDKFISLYDFATLTITNYSHYFMKRTSYQKLPRDADGYVEYRIEYDIRMEKSR